MAQKICRLCFDIISDSFEILDHYKMLLEKIYLNLDLVLTDGSLVCFKCRDTLQQSYYFKMACLANEEIFLKRDSNVKSTLEEIVQENTVQTAIKRKEENVCRLCLKGLDFHDSFVKFVKEKDTFDMEMLHKCLPEIAPSFANRPLICYNCMRNCQNMFRFITNCSNNEEEVKKYLQTNGIAGNSEINLSDVLKFIQDTKNDDEISETELNFAKQEIVKENYDSSSCGSMAKEDFKEIGDCNILRQALSGIRCDLVKKEVIEALGMDEIDIKSEDILWEDESVTTANSFPANSTNETKYKCTFCSYEGKHKRYLQQHLLTHKDTEASLYKCTLCSYEGKHKRYLQQHMLVHKDTSEVTMYKCTNCNFESKYRGYLRKHMMLRHRGEAVIPTYKCIKCSYQSKSKRDLRRHSEIHNPKLSSNVTVYKCTKCNYGSLYKENLQAHMLNHNDNCEVDGNDCTERSREGQHRCYLKKV